jgi:hypothetical protein
MPIRVIAATVVGLYLLIVGLWPAALAPVSLILGGATAVIAAVPGPLQLAAIGIAWAKYRNRAAA